MQIAPDLPMFIKSNKENPDYKSRWFAFLKRAKDCRFFVNSKP
jgi:hypothetical protein